MAEHGEIQSTQKPPARERTLPVGLISTLTGVPPPPERLHEPIIGQNLGRVTTHLTAWGVNGGLIYSVFIVSIRRPWLRRVLGIPLSVFMGGVYAYGDGRILYDMVDKSFTRPAPHATPEQK